MNKKIFTCIDLFSGVGGLTEGFKEIGFKIILSVEFDSYMVQGYKYNHPETQVIHKDIRLINIKDVLNGTDFMLDDIDVVMGGPPCQGFSTVGYRKEDDPRNNLFYNPNRIILIKNFSSGNLIFFRELKKNRLK